MNIPRPRRRRIFALATALATLAPLLGGQSFVKGTLSGATLNDPTSLAFGPDGRLYVTERYGIIRIYTIERTGAAAYAVTATETLLQVNQKPNHTDDGAPDPGTSGRQCTGILVTGTEPNPVIYVTSSDPRVAVGSDSGLDTNSGILTRLTWNGVSWDELDVVRGLPRCEENHASNGMALDPLTNTLYLGQGGHTNMGAPSNSFGQTPEYALSAAILSIDLDAIGETTYDIPTLDDPSRANIGPGGSDDNDPFGGNDGANQAMIVQGGPVQVYAPGFRNAYDVLIHSQDWIYTIDNGPNTGWGGPPVGCSNASNEAGSGHDPDNLHKIGSLGDGGGYYGGHPNPFRADSAVTVNGQSPIPPGAENPVECEYREPGVEDGALKTWNTSTNGLCEYTASNFGGAMQGDILTVGYGSKKVERVELLPDGTLDAASTLFSSVGASPLDIVSHSDTDEWPGTIWVAAFGDDDIVVYEPDDLPLCTGVYSFALDDDNDGYSNADEQDNTTDPCSAGDVPPDFDGDLVSDVNDPDDDEDGVLDLNDAFGIDALNGFTVKPPLHYGWAVGDPGVGFFGMGFTGLMNNGVTDYLDQFVASDVIAGGAAGKFTIDHVGAGDALGAQNDQFAGFQVGVNTGALGPFTARTSVEAPFFDGEVPVDGQSHGLFIGDGGQDDYVKVVLGAGGGSGALEVVVEEGGIVLENAIYPAAVLGALSIELSLAVDNVASTVQPAYRADGGALELLGSPRPLPTSLEPPVAGSQGLAVGLIATAGPSGPDYAATWDYLEIVQDSTASIDVSIGPVAGAIDASTETSGSFRIENTSPDGQELEQLTIDLSKALFADMVFDPNGVAGDSAVKDFTPDSGDVDTGFMTHGFTGPHGGGFDRLTLVFDDFQPGEVFTFSVDVDPTTIKGGAAPGPSDTGNVSGIELAGTQLTASFDDGAAILAQTFQVAGSASESRSLVRTNLPARPDLEVVGHMGAQLILNSPSQTLQVSGAVGAEARLMVVEGGLYLAGLPGGGFDVDPFEANSAVSLAEFSGTIGAGGTVDFPVSLIATDGESGIFHCTAVVVDPDGASSIKARPILIELGLAVVGSAQAALDFGILAAGSTSAPLTATISNTGTGDATVSAIEISGSGEFAIVNAPSLPFALLSGESTQIDVEFAPLGEGAELATLLVTHDAGGSPIGIDLLGDGVLPDPSPLYRVNCGGPEVSALDGGLAWSADTSGEPSPYVNSGATNQTGSGVDVTPHASTPVSAPSTIYKTERYDGSGGAEMEWEFPVASGLFEVRLYVAENWNGVSGPGERVFDVLVEGHSVDDIDAYAEAGFAVGYVRSVVVEVTDGTLDIDFAHDVQNPAIKAIEVRAPSSLVSSRPLISATAGGTQELFLSMGAPNAGTAFIVLSSLSGSSPGLPLGPVLLPVNYDAMTFYSIKSANSLPYVNSFGALDGNGHAEGAFSVPPGLPPALFGVELTHAAALFVGADITDASVAVQMTLTP